MSKQTTKKPMTWEDVETLMSVSRLDERVRIVQWLRKLADRKKIIEDNALLLKTAAQCVMDGEHRGKAKG